MKMEQEQEGYKMKHLSKIVTASEIFDYLKANPNKWFCGDDLVKVFPNVSKVQDKLRRLSLYLDYKFAEPEVVGIGRNSKPVRYCRYRDLEND